MKKAKFPQSVTIDPMPTNPNRYVINELGTGKLLSDAQGYGFASFESAMRYAENQGWLVTNTPTLPEPTPIF